MLVILAIILVATMIYATVAESNLNKLLKTREKRIAELEAVAKKQLVVITILRQQLKRM